MDKNYIRGELKNIKSIIFDFDGTLHNTIKVYYPAFSEGVKILKDHGYAKDFELSEDNVKRFLGERPNFAYDLLAPSADHDFKKKVMTLVGQKMDENIKNRVGKLYDGTEEVLQKLSKSYDLYILSNCRESYLDQALDIYGIKKYFKKYYAAETFDFIPKDEIIKQERKNIREEIIFVGDRHHDMEAARKNNLRSIFCTYGFGPEEGKDATYKIDSIKEILEIL
ncbi:HAD family hydrolase [Peptoniphilus vaginalis]|uniref:HAD family hydrolase n=1 Tax=Peptoniphilus vaginalis TaxID=1756987 RepID=UPI000A27064C|nr:HAD family hydrolase [Peptoniphilus vaginalis]